MWRDCTNYGNRECKPCKEKCPSGQYMVSGCNATHDAVCQNCSTVQQLNCSAKYASSNFFVVACSAMADAACLPCSPECEAGKTYEAQTCSGGQDRICLSCTECLSNKFEATPCTPKKDRRCETCDSGACPPGTWESQPCKQQDPATGLMLNKCTPCSFAAGCNPYHEFNPTYEATPCSGNATNIQPSDRLCRPCTTICKQGQRMVLPCTWTQV
jgi:hypothetical protein